MGETLHNIMCCLAHLQMHTVYIPVGDRVAFQELLPKD